MADLFRPPGAIVEHGSAAGPRAGLDAKIGENTIGGPLSGQDVRMLLDRKTLQQLLDIASQSLSGRVQLDGVGFRQRVWRSGNGHVYQTLTLISLQPRPERTPVDGAVSATRRRR